jgi:hypothetical protein
MRGVLVNKHHACAAYVPSLQFHQTGTHPRYYKYTTRVRTLATIITRRQATKYDTQRKTRKERHASQIRAKTAQIHCEGSCHEPKANQKKVTRCQGNRPILVNGKSTAPLGSTMGLDTVQPWRIVPFHGFARSIEVARIGTRWRLWDHVVPPSSLYRIHCPPTSWQRQGVSGLPGMVVMFCSL